MKNGALLFAAAAGVAPAAATFGHGGFKGGFGGGFGGGFDFGKKFHDADRFTCPGNSKNKCDDKFRGGLDWKTLNPGSFDQFLGFDFKGWTCEDDSDLGKIISGEAGFDFDGALSFGCGKDSFTDKFTVKEFDIDVEMDARLEFQYVMPEGNICKQSSNCFKGKNKIRNTQCGGAKDVKIIYPDGKGKGKGCKVKIPKIDFDCDDNTPPDIPEYTPPPSVPTPTEPDVPDVPEYTPPPGDDETTSESEKPEEPTNTPGEPEYTPPPVETPTGTPSVSLPGDSSTVSVPEDSTKSIPEGSTTAYPPPPPGNTETESTTTVKTITDCGPEHPDCGEGDKPEPTETPDVPDTPLPCPDVVPKCINSWLHLVKECKDNSDAACFCPSKEFVDEAYTCMYAHGETDDIISEALQFFQGMCAPHIPKNPGIVTDIETITTCISVTGTPVVPDVPYTTIVVETTVTEPCVTDGTTESSTTKTISTEITVPELPSQTPGNPGSPGNPVQPSNPQEPGKPAPPPTGGAPPPGVTAPIPTFTTQPGGPIETPGTPTNTPPPAPTAGAGQVRAGLGLGLVVMAVAAAL